jgi:hypothetical protein
MKEETVHNIFQGYKKQLIAKLGTKVTDNVQLEKVGYAVLGTKFKGVYSQDTLPMKKTGYFIINNHTSKQPGEHWQAVYSTPKTIYIHDSFARASKKHLPILYSNAKDVGKKIIDFDRKDKEQKPTTAVCGPLSLAVLLTIKQVGIKSALKL